MAKNLNRPFAKLLRSVPAAQKVPSAVESPSVGPAHEPSPEPRAEPKSFAESAHREGVEKMAAKARVAPPPVARPIPVPTAEVLPFDILDERGVLTGLRIDVDPAELAALTEQRPEALLDLHGFEAEPARRRLHRFIRGRASRGDRILLVIVGKGRGSEGGAGVLRAEVAHWLSEAPVAGYVRAFRTASAALGGGGAISVHIARPMGKASR